MLYRNEYLGEPTGTGGAVFTNLDIREIEDEEIEIFDKISSGIDFGFAIDPAVYTENYYDSTRRILYIYKEIYEIGMSNRVFANKIKEVKTSSHITIADSAEPKSIAELREYDINIYPARKGKDSVDFGIKWLQDLNKIVIDHVRCPNTAKEFNTYEYLRNKAGEFISKYPDIMNHAIDATRYSRESDMENRQVKVFDKNAFLHGLKM